MALHGKIAISLHTDPGRVRKNNEDAVDQDEKIGLIVLADGMGGYKAGEVASGMCVAAVKDAMAGHWPPSGGDAWDESTGFSYVSLMLRDALLAAHRAIYELSQNQPHCEGMGTTVVAVMFFNDLACIAHVGDSRLYRMREGHLAQLTTDHSLVEEMVARGLYSREEALKNVNSNIVTRALGIEPEVEVDLLEERLQPGDLLLLCSDGLSDMLSDEVMRLTLTQNVANLQETGERLIKLANDRGGKDNISVILARIDRSFAYEPSWFDKLRKRLQGEQ